MDCISLLASVYLIGTIVSTNPSNSIAIFSDGKVSWDVKVGSSVAGAIIKEIKTRRTLVLRCQNVIFEKRFFKMPETEEAIGPEPQDDFRPFNPEDREDFSQAF